MNKNQVDLPPMRGMGLSMDEARQRFEQFGAALAEIEPVDRRAAAKVRMEMNAEVFGGGRFLRLGYWRWWWIAYCPNHPKKTAPRQS